MDFSTNATNLYMDICNEMKLSETLTDLTGALMVEECVTSLYDYTQYGLSVTTSSKCFKSSPLIFIFISNKVASLLWFRDVTVTKLLK